MGRRLKDILEMQFNLMYHLHMSKSDIEDADVKELDWIYGRLVEQKKKEQPKTGLERE
jgi:hypothetical protein